ncbi:MAG: hypothetical protein LBJ43_03470 [Propionibacteriaceae bacterium]|jgi:hypothetical protein|nr:hypothetical protein [Propionibacteriaceae bacterium]
MSKHDLKAQPIFHRQRDSIDTHLTTVFAALAITRTIKTRTGLTLKRFRNLLQPLRSATININGQQTTIPPAIPQTTTTILNQLQTIPH